MLVAALVDISVSFIYLPYLKAYPNLEVRYQIMALSFAVLIKRVTFYLVLAGGNPFL